MISASMNKEEKLISAIKIMSKHFGTLKLLPLSMRIMQMSTITEEKLRQTWEIFNQPSKISSKLLNSDHVRMEFSMALVKLI